MLRHMLILQVRRAASLEHFNVGGTFITDVSVLALASHCKLLKVRHKSPLCDELFTIFQLAFLGI